MMEKECNDTPYSSHVNLRSNPLPSQSQPVGMENLIEYPSVEELHQFCNRFLNDSVMQNIRQRACHFFQDIQDIMETEAKIKSIEWYASLVYMALIDTRMPYGPGDPHLEQGSLEPASITVTDILLTADININKLFGVMQVLRSKLLLSRTIQNHLVQMERNYCVVSALFHTFQSRLCPSVFNDEKRGEGTDDSFLPPIPETEGVAFRKKQCWVLFLLSKYRLLRDSQELFQHFQLLLCCLEFVLRQTPSFLLNAPYDSIRFDCSSHVQGTTSMLEKLAEQFEVACDETVKLHVDHTEAFFQDLLNDDGELDSDGLCEEYQKIYGKEGDINELLFLDKDSHLLPLQVSRGSTQSNGHGRLLPDQMTPVRTAVSTVQMLLQNFAGLSVEPSEKLKSYFQKCTHNPEEEIKAKVTTLRDRFIQCYQALTPSKPLADAAGQRFDLGVKIYYKVLETTLDTETDKLPPQKLNDLLNKESFHKSLLACAIEVVLTTYGQSRENHFSEELTVANTASSFPWILEVMSLEAYEFFKVVGTFIKGESRLPMDIVKHLQSVEFRILDHMAWEENSSLFIVIGDWDMGQVTPPVPSSPAKTQEGISPGPPSTNIHRSVVDLYSSPVRPSIQSSLSTSTSLVASSASVVPSSPGRHPSPSSYPVINDASICKLPTPPRSQSLAHFLNKVCRLGFSRLTKLCTHLAVGKELQHKIWTCFEYCVKKMPTLMKNRRIDQIIMCCIYGICKVAEHDLTFKSIVNEYRNLLYATQEVYKDVYISRDRRDSIISFYNNVFMVNIRSYILQFSPNRPDRPQLSPMPKQTASPSYSLPGKRNFMISPLKESPFKAPASPSQMTPHTRLMYCFGDNISSSEKFKDINEKMSARSGPASAKKRLNLDDAGPAASKTRKSIM